MDVDTLSKYAITVCNTKLRLYQSPVIQNKVDGNDEITVNAGALVKIVQTENSANYSKNLTTIQVLDFDNHVHMYENLYECLQTNLQSVSEKLWPFVISIADPEQRVRMIKNTNHCKWLLQLSIGDLVRVSGAMFNTPDKNFDCIIAYIGPCTELYSVGYFFGLEMTNKNNGISPQADVIKVSFSKCDPRFSLFSTANWISEIPKGQQKYSPRDIISGTFEKIKSVIGPSSIVTGSVANNNSSLKENKKDKKNKTPTSNFCSYVDVVTDSYRDNNSNNNTMERSKKGSLNTFSHDFEEFQQSIENRDRWVTNTNTAQMQPKSGILKNTHKEQKQCPEIVIIDKKDIDESARNESNVIVIEKESQECDLAVLLGNQWPHNAGETGAILNKQKFGNNIDCNNIGTSNKANRNKSSNPINHLVGNNAKKANDSISSNSKINDNRKFQNAAYETTNNLPAVLDCEFVQNSSMQEVPDTDLGLGSMVEVSIPESSKPLTGVIRWIGVPPGQVSILIGVELEDDCIDKQIITTDGGFKGVQLFKCPTGRGIFITSDQCSSDRRFIGAEGGAVGNSNCEPKYDNKIKITNGFHDDQQAFGHMDCPVVPGAVAPIKCLSLNSLDDLCGQFKGIQGHHNSCYLDVTLFSMFAFTPVFDAILYRPPESDDISHYSEVQTVLREEIVNPLRKHMFVRADRVMKLRKLLDKLSSVSGLTSEEKDPEEFLNCLLSQIMRAEPFLKLNSGQDAYYYQLFVEKDDRLSFPSVQQLFEQSFYTSDIKLKEVPSCLIIQMPRFGKSFKMYSRILPSQVLDVTDIIDDSPRQCTVCGKLAEFECRECFGILQNGVGLESTSFCPSCLETIHKHAKRANHTHRKLSVPQDFRVMAEPINVPRLYMELFAVVCIETSHYVAFVKSGSGPDAPWCFFDSMADRKGEQNGYNIPEMKTVPELPQWLSDDGARRVNENFSSDKTLPEHAKRLFCDAYMCMYQSTDVMMYR